MMFGKKEINTDRIDTLIGKNTKLQGIVEGTGTIRVDGELTGDLIVEGNVVIGPDGKIIGNVKCDNLFNSGAIRGNAKCNEQLRLASTATLFGDVDVKTFIVDENAIFEGKCKMQNTTDGKSQKSNKSKELKELETKGA